jgi:hypothetical protein
MGLTCTRCSSTGFLNLHQIPENELPEIGDNFHELVLKWMQSHTEHDVTVCDCCGNGDNWHNIPGEHEHSDYGPTGPYAYNGGLPECY